MLTLSSHSENSSYTLSCSLERRKSETLKEKWETLYGLFHLHENASKNNLQKALSWFEYYLFKSCHSFMHWSVLCWDSTCCLRQQNTFQSIFCNCRGLLDVFLPWGIRLNIEVLSSRTLTFNTATTKQVSSLKSDLIKYSHMICHSRCWVQC